MIPKDADAREEQEQHGFHHADPGETAQRGVLQQPRRSHQGQRVEKENEPVGIHRRMSREEEEEGNVEGGIMEEIDATDENETDETEELEQNEEVTEDDTPVEDNQE